MKWMDPVTIGVLLDRSFSLTPLIPERKSVYLVSQRAWKAQPTENCIPLYVGSNTGKSPRFRTRIGDLIADLFGFFGSTGHSTGGQSLRAFCQQNGIHPNALFIGWITECECNRCAEGDLFRSLRPQLNKKRPPRCPAHT